ncbi:MAG: ATPase, T2SS/T4P/T4SS family [Planctomycetota bacterium]|nr:ATPase, T2SS/T4P/T4SS family [Planctomycetota bacterium]
MTRAILCDATPVFLLSPWKPVLVFAVFVAWAWLVSKHLEKDARAAHLNSKIWNGVHIAAACIALAIIIFVPIFYIAYPIAIAVLLGPVLMYWKIRNEAVTEEYKFHLGTDTIKAALADRKKSRASRQVNMAIEGNNGLTVEVPHKEDPSFDIYVAAEELISDAINHRASLLELKLTSKGCQGVRLVDGIATQKEPLSPDLGAKVFAFLKEAAGTDPKDVRRRQTGTFNVSGDVPDTHIDLTASGSTSSHTIRLDFDRKERVLRSWETIGLLPKQRELFDQLKQEDKRHGIVLIGGGKQSGITTTGYAILSQHDSYLCNIVTLEREVYATLEGITHHTLGDISGDYAAHLQTLIRRDPEVILAADLQDSEAAKIAVKTGTDGPLLFITMPADSTSELLSKWAGHVSDPRQSFSNLKAVAFQRLVRRLCDNCRAPYKPTPDLKKQGLPVDSVEQLYRKGGQVEIKNKIVTCPVCEGSGYLGQVGVFETMFLDSDTRKNLIAGDLRAAMAQSRRNKGMIRLQEAAWEKVADGTTSIEEFARVNKKKKSSKKSPKQTSS